MSGDVFSPITCLHHYLSMARGNYREYLQGELVKIKKYFYVLRPILACKWIEKYNSIPPLLFEVLLDNLLHEGELKIEINSLLIRKVNGDELNLEQRIYVINQYIDDEIKHLEEYTNRIKYEPTDPTTKLDQLFRETLIEAWST